jgi:hypothetical protein
VTRRLPERNAPCQRGRARHLSAILLGSVAVLDIVVAHRESNPDRVTSGVPTAACSCGGRRAMAHPPRRIPAAIFPRPVQEP